MSGAGDAALVRAFERGQSAERNDRLRSENPYRPSEPQWGAWNDGFDYEEIRYSVRTAA